jgi:hypothetical protein
MKAISKVEQELNRIRLEIYEETKNLTLEQRIERANKIGEAMGKKYGFKILQSTNGRKSS